MAKNRIVTKGSSRAPFLRGILIRSLQEAGLSFDEAYKLASAVRRDLSDIPEISTEKLRVQVIERLIKAGSNAKIIDRYRNPPAKSTALQVRLRDGRITPFSSLEFRHELASCGLRDEEADLITAQLLLRQQRKEVDIMDEAELENVSFRYLRRFISSGAAERLQAWDCFRHSGQPLLLLIGGVPGSGKSTLASELANRLGIVRTQSTDMLRELMRAMLPQRLLPVLHRSSFDAWKALPGSEHAHSGGGSLLIDGFRGQTELLSVACEAVVQRALKERVSMILEGVHVYPSLLEKLRTSEDAIVVPIMLSVLDRERLYDRFVGRGRRAPERRATRYQKNFDSIWELQTHLLNEAKRSGMSIVGDADREIALQRVLVIVADTLRRHFCIGLKPNTSESKA